MRLTVETETSPLLAQNTRETLRLRSGQEWGTRTGDRDAAGRWARVCATAGAAVWAGMAVLARIGYLRIGAIELLFSFAPLVILPLGMELQRVMGAGGWLETIARRVQPLGAGCAVVAIAMAPGRRAGMIAVGWMVVCLVMAAGGLFDLLRDLVPGLPLLATAARSGAPTVGMSSSGKSPHPLAQNARRVGHPLSWRATLAVARIDLAVGGAWLVASRLGLRVMGIQEPIGLLTAVHFHFAGFATATIAAAALAFAQRRGMQRWLGYLVPLVVGLPYAVAVGFVISPVLKMIAAILFSASVAGLAVAVRACGGKAEPRAARVLFQVAAGAVFAGMVLAGAYAVSDFLGSDALIIPQMARTHGLLNGMGFCLLGLLGWLVEFSTQLPVPSTQ